ncbi:hypothetical protein FAI41_02925 [Acetobacteraceae bacterium]|nr:hypothetical protein FAI41_02925 [Acetobacteraceae bacterium]
MKKSLSCAASLLGLSILSACQMQTNPKAPPPIQPDSKNYSKSLPQNLQPNELDPHFTQAVKAKELAQWCLSNDQDHMQGSGGTISGNPWNAYQQEDYFCAIPLVASTEYQAVILRFQPLSDKKSYFQADLAHLPAMTHHGFVFKQITLYQLKEEFRKNKRFEHTVLWEENRAPTPYAKPPYWPCYEGWPFGMVQPASPICHPDLQNHRLIQSQVRY